MMHSRNIKLEWLNDRKQISYDTKCVYMVDQILLKPQSFAFFIDL